MRIALILFGDEKIYSLGYLNSVLTVFEEGAIKPDTVEILSVNDDIRFRKRLLEFRDTVDLLVVLDSEKNLFSVKGVVSDAFNTPLIENENARRFISAISVEKGRRFPEELSLLPLEASVIPNLKGEYQGFILDKDEFTLVVLPSELDEFKNMAKGYLIPCAEKKFSLKRRKITLKYFGDEGKLISVIDGARSVSDCEFNCSVKENFGDYTVNLLFDGATNSESSAAVRYILTELKDDIYAEEDKTLSERLFDLLQVKNKKIAVAESFTGGRVVSEIIKNSGVSAYLYEGVVSYSNESKISRLNVKKEDLIKEGAVSSVVAYEMAAGLLKTGKTDIAIATTGIAGPKSDNTEKPVGLCFIAVGTVSGVHTYKYKLMGTREQITETAKNTALFLAIKNLKRM